MKRFIEQYGGEIFDLLVIGGGISGAAVAYDAASRGLSVGLVEKQDFGCGTSAATSKLIHGGLRYLANFEFSLVRESLRERRTMENIAPNLVYPLPVLLASYDRAPPNDMKTLKKGMIVYDLLSFDKGWTWDKSKKLPRHQTIPSEKVIELEPVMKKEGLKGGHIYSDCSSIFPERLTLAFIKSGVRHGAMVSNYVKAEGFLMKDEKTVCGIRGKDLLNGKEYELKGKLCINCGGPWADIILGMASGGGGDSRMVRSEGIHVITKRLTKDHMVTLSASGGKGYLFKPWRGRTLIGLTDKEYSGDPDDYNVTKESILDLLENVNKFIRDNDRLKYGDILYAYGGLRPLVENEFKDVRKMSRKYEIKDNSEHGIDGLITVEGGKYTTARNLAQNVMKTVSRKLNKRLCKCVTGKQRLAGCEIHDMPRFLDGIKKENRDFHETTIESLGKYYGTEYGKVVDLARQDKELAETVNDDGEILAQVVYAIRDEMARTLKDIFFRRTSMGTLGDPGQDLINRVADIAARELDWEEFRKLKEISEVAQAVSIPD